MLKMQLPVKKAEEGGDTVEDEKERGEIISDLAFARAVGGLEETTEEEIFPLLTKESVYEWFGLRLQPARRVEFLFGLLHMCQPLELRFLGSCFEDLARKDFHVFRDFEMRANSPSEVGLLTDVSDPATRAKLLVCLSLLGSGNRECAGIMFRILDHMDPALLVSSYPASPVCSLAGDSHGHDVQSRSLESFVESRFEFLEQLSVLYTMASLHPAFLFHQRGKLRTQLEKLEHALFEEQSRHHCQQRITQSKPQKLECLFARTEVCGNQRTPSHHSRRVERDAVYIEKIVLKGISLGKMDREYSFEVKWSDFSTSSVTKTHLDLENFLLKLPKEHSSDSFERGILRLLNQGQRKEDRKVEQSLKELFLAAPQHFRQKGKVCVFFHCGASSPTSLSCGRCIHISSGTSYKEDCSETSSQDEDMKPCAPGNRKKPSNKSSNLNMWYAEGKRMAHGAENQEMTEWKKKNCALKPFSNQNAKPVDGELKSSSTKSKARATHSNRNEKGEKGTERVCCITNGVISPPSPLAHNYKGKAIGPCPKKNGDTSSESYSSPPSPQYDGRESLESEDEKGKDIGSPSDDSRNSVFFCPVTEDPVDAHHPLVPLKQGGQEIHPEGSLRSTAVEFSQLHYTHHARYPVHNGPDVLMTRKSPQLPDTKVETDPVVIPTSSMAKDGPEKCSSEVLSAVQSFNTSGLGVQSPGSPVLQRFKTAGAQSNTEGGVFVPPAHQTPISAISVQCGTTYPQVLQAAYANTNPLLSSLTPAESHTKPAELNLSSVLPPSFNLPNPNTGIPQMGTVGSIGTASSPQGPALVVPTHTPGPAPSPIPSLTHSTAQSDGNSYINSNASNSIPQLQQQQLPATQQVIGCNACGCRGNCGSSHAPNYYIPTQMTPRQVFNIPPIFQLASLCSSSYLRQLNQTPQSNGTNQVPFYPTAPGAFPGGTLLHPHSHTHSDHVLCSQTSSFGLQHMTAFNRFYQPIYAAMIPGTGSKPGMPRGTVSGGINKKNGSISCYNCGGSGHYAQDCKQPPIDSTQQGGYRLKYAPQSEVLDGNPD